MGEIAIPGVPANPTTSISVGTLYTNIFVGNRVSISLDSDAVDVSGATIISVVTSGGSVTIGGLAGGIEDQIVFIYKSSSANNLIIEHNEATGTQKIITHDTSDITLTNYGGIMLIFSGANWFEINR